MKSQANFFFWNLFCKRKKLLPPKRGRIYIFLFFCWFGSLYTSETNPSITICEINLHWICHMKIFLARVDTQKKVLKKKRDRIKDESGMNMLAVESSTPIYHGGKRLAICNTLLLLLAAEYTEKTNILLSKKARKNTYCSHVFKINIITVVMWFRKFIR